MMFPTPSSTDYKGAPSLEQVQKRAEEHSRGVRLPEHEVGGQLNPDWVEKLMGWPAGWSDINQNIQLDYYKWEFSNAKSKNRAKEKLQSLWEATGKEALQRSIRGLHSLPESKTLLAVLREHQNEPDIHWLFEKGLQIQENLLRIVRFPCESSDSPYRSETGEQLTGELADALQTLSRFLAQYGEEAWRDGSWENATPRITTKKENRINRLKAIGNGQVPAAVAAAWGLLSDDH